MASKQEYDALTARLPELRSKFGNDLKIVEGGGRLFVIKPASGPLYERLFDLQFNARLANDKPVPGIASAYRDVAAVAIVDPPFDQVQDFLTRFPGVSANIGVSAYHFASEGEAAAEKKE